MSRGPEILRLAAKMGVGLWLEGDLIAYRAPGGLDTTVARAIRQFRADVVEELRRQAEEEERAIADYAAREQLAQEAARIRIASGTSHRRDEYLAAGASIAEAERLALRAVLENQRD